MSNDESMQVLDRFFDALNRHDYTVINDLVIRPILAKNIRGQQEQIRSILSDVHYRVETTVAEGQEIWAFCTLHGVHTGTFETPFAEIAPTNREVVVEQICRFRLVGQKIDLVVDMTDLFGLLLQMTL